MSTTTTERSGGRRWWPVVALLGLTVLLLGVPERDPGPAVSAVVAENPSVYQGEPIGRLAASQEVAAAVVRTNGGSLLVAASRELPPGTNSPGLINTHAYERAGFDRLASFAVPARQLIQQAAGDDELLARLVDAEIPQPIRDLNDRAVVLTGFMMPLRMADGQCVEFLLVRSQAMCCFGAVPELNEWVHVTMSPPGARAELDQLLNVFGTLRVGAVLQDGFFSGIYRLAGQRTHRAAVR